MAVILDPFSGQLIDIGPTGLVIGGSVAGADPNSVLVVDSALTLQNVQMPTDGQLLIGSAGGLPIASTLTQASASQVVITNGPGSITLALPQDISTADSPEFTGLTLSSLSGPVKAGVGGVLSSSAIDLSTSEVTNILTVDKGGTGVNGSAAPNGHILIGNGTGYTLADILGTTHQINVTNGAGSITLSLPQDIHTGASPEFSNLSLAGTLDTAILGGTLGVGTNKASIINIGNPTATVNIQGTTIYQNVTNLNVTDKNITVNVGGSVGSSGGAGIHVEEGGVSNAGHAEVTGDRLGWEFHPPGVAGIAYLYPGASGITLNQSSHDPVTLASPANGLGILNQVLSLELSSASSTGALSATDWSTFNNKEPAIPPAPVSPTLKYWRGDKSWQTLDTAVVPENGNLYFTNTRVYSALSATLPISFSSGVISISQSNTTTNGYLSSTDWNTFNNKQDYIPPGLATEFYRGDKTFAKVNLTSDVTGTLPFANGGLGFNTYPGANYVIGFNNANNAVEGKQFIAGTGVNITHGTGSITVTNTIASSSDIGPSSWSGLANNTSNQTITGLSFSSSVGSFIAFIDILIDATSDLYAYVEVRGKRKSASNWSSNDVQCNFTGDEIAGLDFNITSGGQVTINIGNISGYVSGTLKFRAFALS
jgi:hypothetical protein